MGSYTAKEARQHWTQLLAEVRGGDHPLVTFHDHDVAYCVPAAWYEQVQQTFRDFNDLADLLSRGPEELRRMRETLDALGDFAGPRRTFFGDLGTVDDVLRRNPEQLENLRETLDLLRKLAPPLPDDPDDEHQQLRQAG